MALLNLLVLLNFLTGFFAGAVESVLLGFSDSSDLVVFSESFAFVELLRSVGIAAFSNTNGFFAAVGAGIAKPVLDGLLSVSGSTSFGGEAGAAEVDPDSLSVVLEPNAAAFVANPVGSELELNPFPKPNPPFDGVNTVALCSEGLEPNVLVVVV